MKILLISVKSNVSRGGIAVWTDRFLESCSDHGISCDVVNTEAIGNRREHGTSNMNVFDEFARTRRIFKDLKSFLTDATQYDAVHLNTSCGTFGLFRDYICAKQIKKRGLRLITHFHCDIPYWIGNPLSLRCLGKIVGISDERLVLCENSRKYIENNFATSSRKISNFIDRTTIIDGEKHISQKIQTAIFVGRVEEAKGARELYALATKVSDVQFVLAGEVSETVAHWDKPRNITLMGSLPHADVLLEMDKSDVFVFPSHSEGFSLALTEAMARGLPCIATDVGANADMLADGCGVITAVGDISAMERALDSIRDPGI